MALGLINPSGVKGILHKGYLGMGIGKRITWEMQQAVSMVLMAYCDFQSFPTAYSLRSSGETSPVSKNSFTMLTIRS